MLTTYDVDDYVFAALRAGASGFMLKDVRPAELVEAVRVVAGGDALLAPSVTRRLLDRVAGTLPGPDATPPPDLRELTDREVEVLRLVALALSNAEIARAAGADRGDREDARVVGAAQAGAAGPGAGGRPRVRRRPGPAPLRLKEGTRTSLRTDDRRQPAP